MPPARKAGGKKRAQRGRGQPLARGASRRSQAPRPGRRASAPSGGRTSKAAPARPAARAPAPDTLASRFLAAWHEAARARSVAPLLPFISETVTLASPALMKPRVGRDEVSALLRDVVASLRGYHVTRTWAEGRDLLLEFEAYVGDRLLRGIDRLTLDEEGRLAHLEVFIRPFKGLLALMRSVVELQLARLPLHRRLLARAQVALKTRGR